MWTTSPQHLNASCETYPMGFSREPSALPGWRSQVGPAVGARPEIQAVLLTCPFLSEDSSLSPLCTWARHSPEDRFQSPSLLCFSFLLSLYT